MKIQVKELGAIKEGTIDLSKKLNVFCGPNGTGKTYMAYVIYGLLKNQIHIGSDEELVKNLIEKKTYSFPIDFDSIHEYRNSLIGNFKEDFDSLFGIGEDLAKTFFGDTIILFDETNLEYETKLFNCEINSTITIRKTNINVSKVKNSNELKLEITQKSISNEEINALNFFLKSELLSFLATYPISSVFILPVERNSIFTFSKELSISKQEAVDHFHAMTSKNKIDRYDILFKKTTRYPLAIKDGLMIADDLAETQKNTSEYMDFANEIENELLHGKVIINSNGEIQFKSEKAPKKSLPIHMTASIIKSLSSLVVYLKHIAKKNDLIIIDEPEINLHPDNQIILTRLFARLINKGFRLLISTHSDYVVREINNLIMLSSTKNEVIELKSTFGYKTDEQINKEDIDVNYFNFPEKKSNNKQLVISKLEISNSGFEIPSVNKTIEDQNNIAEELFYALEYAGEDE
jgi:energy-coupling factor transporter ATP-binding protein EcfA2